MSIDIMPATRTYTGMRTEAELDAWDDAHTITARTWWGKKTQPRLSLERDDYIDLLTFYVMRAVEFDDTQPVAWEFVDYLREHIESWLDKETNPEAIYFGMLDDFAADEDTPTR